jgi:hypothetical protein
VIAFAVAVSEPEAHRRYAEPGIRAAAEADSEILAFAAVAPLARAYNLLLDAAARFDDLEALVLLHPHAQIADPRFCEKVREALADPEVAVVGCAGGSGARGLAWWEGDVVAGPVVHRYTEHGGGELPAYGWASPRPAPAEVDAVDGFLLVLSPWAVRSVRFDEGLWLGTGFDVDYCRQVRAAGRKVLVADLGMVLHRSLELFEEPELWMAADQRLAEKWEDGEGTDWQARARRAEAEREAARAVTYFRALRLDARVDELERAVEEAKASPSWRVTAPLRRLNAHRRGRR